MYISGVGGTGKSHIIKCIVKFFTRCGAAHCILLSAPTGIAAKLSNSFTAHSLTFMTHNEDKVNLQKLTDLWKDINYLVVNEVSMVFAEFMAKLSD